MDESLPSSSQPHVLRLPDAAATRSLGIQLGQTLPAGSVLLLEGDLGSGKTTLVQGIGAGLGITESIDSPTFTLINEYLGGRLPLYHFDLYRLNSTETAALYPETYWEGNEFEPGIVAIEWAERLPYKPANYLLIRLRHSGSDREVEIVAVGERAIEFFQNKLLKWSETFLDNLWRLVLLRPEEDVHKCLISSPARLIAEYDESDFLITQAFPSINDSILQVIQREGSPSSRYYYVCVFRIAPPELAPGVVVPDHSHVGNLISIALSVFYGKRFNNHGVIESHGRFSMPLLSEIAPMMQYYYFGSNNHQPRKDLSIELDLRNCKPIIEFLSKSPNHRLKQTFFTAGKFYLSSLQLVDTDMERAFLDLVTCGEILSNYFQYSENEMFNNQLKEMFERLDQVEVDPKDIKLIKSRLYQVKAKFTLTFQRLLNKKFFSRTESLCESAKLNMDNIEKCIKAVYDLRSRYVHDGITFGKWLIPHRDLMNEIQLGTPVVSNKELEKILYRVPTYIGLERVVRFALLRLLHTEGVYIHAELE